MLNKILIFSVIFFNLIMFNVYSNDQITFDVSEIEILDGGNKIIGKNRGSINTNDGVTIEADKFEFDKIKNILKAQGNIKVNDKLNNYDFNAQKLSYFKDKEKIKIEGKAEALIGSNYRFITQDINISVHLDTVIQSVDSTASNQSYNTNLATGGIRMNSFGRGCEALSCIFFTIYCSHANLSYRRLSD